MPPILSAVFAIATASSSLAAAAQPADPTQQSISAIKKSIELRPLDPTLYFYLALFQSRAKERDNALGSLEKVDALGDGFLPGPHFGFDNLLADPDFARIRARLESRLPVVASAPVAFSIADKSFGPEGIAYDAASKDFFVGSITHKRIVRISQSGKLTPFVSSGLQHVLGVTVDAKRRLLYAVSTNAVANLKPAYNAVLGFDLTTGKPMVEYVIPTAGQLNDLAVAPDGVLYVSDSTKGMVWRLAPADPTPKPLMAAGAMRGCNGLALTPDGKTLYVAHSTGVTRVDTATGKLDILRPPARQTIAAIDGLYWWRGALIGIQNITNPGRVIRLRLNRTGTEIDTVDTLQSHHNPAFDEPTTGAIAGDAIYVLGTTQLPRYDEKGEINSPAPLKEPKVVRVPLGRK